MRSQPLTRRQALEQISGGVLLSLGLWPGACLADASQGDGAFKFIVVNDTHLMSTQCGEWLQGVVRQMKTHQPAFCLHLGDLTEHGRREHLAAVRDIFQALGCPVFPVIGNHDYHSPDSARYYRLFFPRRFNYMVDWNGWQFVGLDTTEGQKYEKTSIQPETLRWVELKVPKLDRRRPTVVFTHFPLGAGVKYRPLNADLLLEQFKGLNLQAVFSGHWHGYTERQWENTPLYTNRCCALKRSNHDRTTQKGYFACEASQGRVRIEFVAVPCPETEKKPPASRPS